MENHIYPLNIEEPTPLGSRPKRKKPTFKEWIKDRKKMVIFVCTVAILSLATVAIYATGLSDKMLGFTGVDIKTTGDETMEDFDITGSVIPKDTTEGQGVTLTYLVNRTTNINKIVVLKSDNTPVKILTSRQIEVTTPVEKTIKWDGKNSSGVVAPAGNYKFKMEVEYLTVTKDPNNLIQPKIEWHEYTKEFTFSVVSVQKIEISGTVSPTQQAVGQEVILKFSTSAKATVDKVEALESNNAFVKKIIGSTATEANIEKTIKWDGKNSSGVVAPAGNYKFRVTAGTLQKDFTFTTIATQENTKTVTAVALSLTVTPESPQVVNTEVTFKLEATASAAPYNFRIEFGDGGGDVKAKSTSNIVTFTHKYTKSGTYTVSAGVTSALNVNDPVPAKTTYKILDAYQCSNGADDDKDGKIDLNDPGCANGSDNDEADVVTPPKAQCNDGIDNDTDGKVDYPNDPGCAALDDITESPDTVVTPPGGSTPEPPLTAKETKCDDGKDNDNDGKEDYEDSDCKAPKDASIKITDVGVTSQKLNPALNAVKIYYKLSDSANVKVEVKSTQGDITIPLFEGKQEKQTGNFSVWWEGTLDNKPNGQKAPDGTYTYKISATHLKYPSVKDSKEGTVTVDSAYNPGGLDFEDINNANLLGDAAGQGQGAGQGAGQSTPSTPSQNQATIAIQSATTGNTAGTGPGVVIYFLFPLFTYAYKKIKY